jgi:putative oxidoreductase
LKTEREKFMNSEKASGPEKAAELKLDDMGQEVVALPGGRIVSQGEAPEFFYVIQSGKVRVFRETEDGIRTPLTELGPGAYFGEVALVTGQPRTASVEAIEESRLIKISKEEFDRLLDENPRLARHIINQLSQWLVAGDRRLETETVHQVKLRQVSWFDYVLILGLSLVFAVVFNLYNDNQIPLVPQLRDGVPTISMNKAVEYVQNNGALFVDARKSNFFDQRHIKGALNLPVIFFDLQFPMFQFMLTQMEGAKEKPIIVYGGNFSRRFDLELAHLLMDKGYKVMVFNDYGGWEKALPTVAKKAKPLPSMPLGFAGAMEWLPVSIFVLFLIPPVRRSPYLSVGCRLILGVIFIGFALSKIMRPAVFALNVVEYGLTPAWGVNLWALFLPWAELLAGLFLVLGIRTRASATIIGGMNVIFIVGLVNAIFLGLPINCGCVGEVGEPVTWWKVLKNSGMLFMALQIFLYDRLFVLDRGGFVWRARPI